MTPRPRSEHGGMITGVRIDLHDALTVRLELSYLVSPGEFSLERLARLDVMHEITSNLYGILHRCRRSGVAIAVGNPIVEVRPKRSLLIVAVPYEDETFTPTMHAIVQGMKACVSEILDCGCSVADEIAAVAS